ncbi:hypothetical protein FOFC_04281 [Fusarium oxysporum]|nr:hypothetical protein FOFC_04281 [Fusarium oxysporum]
MTGIQDGVTCMFVTTANDIGVAVQTSTEDMYHGDAVPIRSVQQHRRERDGRMKQDPRQSISKHGMIPRVTAGKSQANFALTCGCRSLSNVTPLHRFGITPTVI